MLRACVVLLVVLAGLGVHACLGDEPPLSFRIAAPEPGVLVVEVSARVPERCARPDSACNWTIAAPGFPLLDVAGVGRFPFISLTLEGDGPYCAAQALFLASDTLTVVAAAMTRDELMELAEGQKYVEGETELARGFCPAEPVRVFPVGAFRGTELKSVQLFPFCYDAQRGVLIVHRKMLVRLVGVRLPARGRVEKTERASLSSPMGRAGAFSAQRLRIVVKEEGLYHIPAARIAEAGVELSAIDPTTLRLTNRGKQVPIYVGGERDGRFDAEDYVEFWGMPNRQTFQALAVDMYMDPYTDENTYWLSWGEGPGIRLSDQQVVTAPDGQWVTVPRSYWCTIHVEEDNSFNRLSQLPADSLRDHWFFDSGLQAGMLHEYRFHLPWPDPEAAEVAELHAMVYGLSAVPGVPHQVALFLNGCRAAEAQWMRQDRYELRTPQRSGVPPERLKPGQNVLTLVNNRAPEEVDLVALNWFEISYGRLYRAENDYIEFGLPKNAPPGFYEFRVCGFSTPEVDVYKLGLSRIVGAKIQLVQDAEQGDSYEVAFQDYVASPSVRYVAVAGSAKKAPPRVERARVTWLRAGLVGVDYVAIGPDSLLDHPALRELLAHRQAQGLRTLAVPLQDIYDEFNYGIASPHALKDFLRHAWQNYLPPRLRYVLLVGDGSWDYKNRHRRGGNLVPVFLRQTIKFGAVASDHWYALVDGEDEVPDLFIGRLPVRNSQELAAVVQKILIYERTSPMDDWRNRLLFLSGVGSVFRQQSEAILSELIPPSFTVERLYTTSSPGQGPFWGSTERLLQYFAQGVAYVNFLGHGGGAVWSDNSLFRLDDVARLSPSVRCPIVSSMTCFTGSFEEPTRRSLGEELLVAQGTGAVAVLGASGVGWLYNDYYLLREFVDELLNAEEETTLGEIIARAKIRYLSAYPGYLTYSMVSQYNLLGDPALCPVLPRRSCQVQLSSRTARPGEVLQVNGRYEQISGMAVLELADHQRATVVSLLCPVRNGLFSSDIVVPTGMSGAGSVRAYVYDELTRQAAHGALSFAAAELHIDSVWTRPSWPGTQDSVRVYARIFSARRVEAVSCLLTSPSADTIQMEADPNDSCVFLTERPLCPYEAGTEVSGKVLVSDHAGNAQERTFSYSVARGPELFIDPVGVRLGGISITQLEVPVWNTGDVACKGVRVDAVLVDSLAGTYRLLGSTQVDLGPRQSAKAVIPGFFGGGWVLLRLVVDADNQYPEGDEDNNVTEIKLLVDRYVVTPEVGSTLRGEGTDTLHLGPGLSLFVAPGSASTPTVVWASFLDSVQVWEQPDLHVVRGAAPPAWEVTSSAPHPPFEAVVRVSVVGESLGPAAGIFVHERRSRKWRRAPTWQSGPWVYAQVLLPARIALLESYDTTPPRVEILVDGQLYSPGAYVSSQPLVTFVLQDANGVALCPQSLRITLDGKDVPWGSLLLPDSVENANQVPVSMRPQLSPGGHTCQVEVWDCSGNVAGPMELVLKVASAFDVRVLGTYPNPFARQTVFVYELSRWAEDFSLSIFTTSGHLVRRFTEADALEGQNPRAPGYHEITWDGTDANGDEVANGVYFYRLRCADGERVLEHKGVVARLR